LSKHALQMDACLPTALSQLPDRNCSLRIPRMSVSGCEQQLQTSMTMTILPTKSDHAIMSQTMRLPRLVCKCKNIQDLEYFIKRAPVQHAGSARPSENSISLVPAAIIVVPATSHKLAQQRLWWDDVGGQSNELLQCLQQPPHLGVLFRV